MYSLDDAAGSQVERPPLSRWRLVFCSPVSTTGHHCPDFPGLLCNRENPSLLPSPAQRALGGETLWGSFCYRVK